MGLFYGVMAVRKRSLGLAALAVVTGNMGLWVLWHRCGWDFLEHPQLWLIPLALAVLVAEHLDRRRLSEPQRAAIRYLALSVIYVSSTTEFWRHIGQSAVLPLVTILLAVLGVLAGILLRVRSLPLPRLHLPDGGHRPDDRLRGLRAAAHLDLLDVLHHSGRGDHRAVRRLREAAERRAGSRRAASSSGTVDHAGKETSSFGQRALPLHGASDVTCNHILQNATLFAAQAAAFKALLAEIRNR